MKRLLLPLALLAAPLAAQDVNIPHTTFTLPNGLRVIVAEDKSTPIAAVNVWYHVGSGFEQPGRTGFAHLFEHIMFEGSANVPEGDFDKLLEAAGGNNNGSTTQDRTNYYAIVPSNAVDLALWLEADRMGGLLQTMSPTKLDIQRDVVKNERRQSYENRPYGMLQEIAAEALYPKSHPYSWSTIGSMADLTSATLEDVSGFFRTYYVPNNAVLTVAGDVNTAQVRQLVERYFGWIPRGPDVAKPRIQAPQIPATRYITREDRVTLPQVNILWRTSPRFSPDEAAIDALAQILAGGKSSRLYQRLVYTEQNAQMVSAFNWAKLLSGDLFMTVRGKQNVNLNVLERAVMEEIAKIAATPPSAEELQRVVNSIQTEFVGSLETVGGKADQLNSYMYYGGSRGWPRRTLPATGHSPPPTFSGSLGNTLPTRTES